ncbi:MAG TPA: SMI1/KNR4 family protein, partial [Xanthobacteraceae bacterium]|nr:SMI1/KNR4 family protein [Xanthobacteraceae bacterium]
MYLAKFFHRPPGNDDRELLLILDSSSGDGHSLLGFNMGGPNEPYLREDFSSARAAISALRREAEGLRRCGYGETADTRYTLRALAPNPRPKPAWQQGLDELLLCALLDDAASQSALMHKLAGTPAAQEPLYLWIAARYGFAT